MRIKDNNPTVGSFEWQPLEEAAKHFSRVESCAKQEAGASDEIASIAAQKEMDEIKDSIRRFLLILEGTMLKRSESHKKQLKRYITAGLAKMSREALQLERKEHEECIKSPLPL